MTAARASGTTSSPQKRRSITTFDLAVPMRGMASREMKPISSPFFFRKMPKWKLRRLSNQRT